VAGIVLEEVGTRSDVEWEAFLDGDTDGTLFHRLAFLGYHARDRFRAHPLKVRRSGCLIAVIPLADGEGESADGVASPYGGSFGGFATGPGVSGDDHLAILDALLQWTRDRGYRSVWISSRPAPYRRHGDGAERALAARGFEIVRREITHVADLSGTSDDVLARVRGTSRRGARKAERLGTVVRPGRREDFAAFHAILTADRARLDAVPTHTLADLLTIDAARPGDLTLLVAENGAAMVGGLLLFRATREVALSFYTARSHSPSAERCMNLLTERALLECHARGFGRLDFGTSSRNGILNPGLAEFKEGFGGVPFERETWRLGIR
jgi:hypothetical protein